MTTSTPSPDLGARARHQLDALTSAQVREIKPADLEPGSIILGHGRRLPCRTVESVRVLPFSAAEITFTDGGRSIIHGVAYLVDVPQEEAPRGTSRVVMDVVGVADIPRTFADDLRALVASLDWARAFAQANKDRSAGDELRSAALRARSIERVAWMYARQADHRAGREDVPADMPTRAESALSQLLTIAQGLDDDRADQVSALVADLAQVAGIDRPEAPPMPCAGTVKVLRVRYAIGDDGSGGSMPVYQDVDDQGAPEPHSEDLHQVEDTSEAARIICEAGCTSDQGHWWADPDSSHTVDYALGVEEETTCHLDGFTDAQLADIARRVRLRA